MNGRNGNNRRGSQRKPENNGPLFCNRCGGALMAQNTFSPTNVCRCKKEAAPAAKHVVAPVAAATPVATETTPAVDDATPAPVEAAPTV